jgi:hypothetical protein
MARPDVEKEDEVGLGEPQARQARNDQVDADERQQLEPDDPGPYPKIGPFFRAHEDPDDEWEPRRTGLEAQIPFLVGWAVAGDTTTCCPCGYSSGCGLVLQHLNVPKGVARFTLVT